MTANIPRVLPRSRHVRFSPLGAFDKERVIQAPIGGEKIGYHLAILGVGPTHDLARTLQPFDLWGYHFISQGALAHH